jgi:hypothetical protein
MRVIRLTLAFISVIIIVLLLITMNYSDMSWAANKNNYLGLAACVLNIWALLYLIKDRKK